MKSSLCIDFYSGTVETINYESLFKVLLMDKIYEQ